jgi:hypothetical protein
MLLNDYLLMLPVQLVGYRLHWWCLRLVVEVKVKQICFLLGLNYWRCWFGYWLYLCGRRFYSDLLLLILLLRN